MVANETNDIDKIKILYKYLQNTTRYVSIQLGIGGWKNTEAMKVATSGYGDCKALSNYMVAMLKAVGINAKQAIISGGDTRNFLFEDFPSMQFNHAITCVPLKKDTLWLECTSQTNTFGYLGDFTGNRMALLLESNGGKLVKTKTYQPEENLRQRTALIKLTENNEAKVKISTSYWGIQSDSWSSVSQQLSDADQKTKVTESITIPSFEILDYKFNKTAKDKPQITLDLELLVRNIASSKDKNIFLKPNLMSGFFQVPIDIDTRKHGFYLNENTYRFLDVDSLIYEVPTNFSLENEPVAKIESKFGTYEMAAKMLDGKLIYVRKIKMLGGYFPVEAYREWGDFLKKIKRADNRQVVLIEKKT